VAHAPDEKDPRPSDVGQRILRYWIRSEAFRVDAQGNDVDAISMRLQERNVAHEGSGDEDACRLAKHVPGERGE
jgi:hypothetical protein